LNPHGRKVKPEELIVDLAKDAVGLIAGTESITEEIIMKLPPLKVISRCGVGVDNVALDAAKRLEIKVFNTSDAPTVVVAKLTVGLILNLLIIVSRMDREIRNEHRQKRMGNLLCRKKIGIVEFGRIGRRVAELLIPFGCEIVYADPFV